MAPTRPLHDGPVPLYHQLEKDLVDRISGGEFAPGDLLPSEEGICEQYGVSRITVRRALEALIHQGLIVRRRGVGSFVAERRPGIRSVRLAGSLEDFLATAGSLHLNVLSLGEVEPTSEVRDALELQGPENVVRLELVSSLESGPVIYLEAFFPLATGRLLRAEDIVPGQTVVRVAERKLNLRVIHAHQLMQSALAGETAAAHLGIAPDCPVLRIRRVYYTAGDRPMEVAILRLHPERYQYEIEFRARTAHL